MTIAIIVHGGASTVPPEQAHAFREGCLRAVQAGWALLQRGASACDAVEAAVRVMEEDPTFNAAYGGALNADGVVEMDAALMEGGDLRYGALAATQGLRHPISVARRILEVGPLLLSGEGARRFAQGAGAELCDPAELTTDKQRQQWEQTEEQMHEKRPTEPGTNDTVGCIALDASGLIAVGSSTGGEDHNPPGRVGDTAQIGCGVYADNSLGGCAVSGTGEAIMQIVVAKSAIELLAAGLHPDEAARQIIDTLGERVSGEGGCIILDRRGRTGWAHNSPDMTVALMDETMEAPRVWTRKK
ncbi:MAG TPA: isoaspartyl peptidase/L-asparaginase family protein [Roseiflexaceae bacterium]|nr:isoaspartyl peptidase/L-asparaginase family protein [Roseiflexaceae bacterium]